MEVKSKKETIVINSNGKKCSIHSLQISISDIKGHIDLTIKSISDSSWIDEMDVVSKISFKARAEKTINKLVNDIFSKVSNEVTKEIGEYLISHSAQIVLENELAHKKVPLAELIKERITGNQGFDFHTETKNKIISFGEAKYSSSGNPYARASGQIIKFIQDKKDDSELVDIEKFVTSDAIKNYTSGNKAFTIAFSLNGNKREKIMNNAFNSKHVKELSSHSEVYIIGVSIDD